MYVVFFWKAPQPLLVQRLDGTVLGTVDLGGIALSADSVGTYLGPGQPSAMTNNKDVMLELMLLTYNDEYQLHTKK